MIGTADAPDVVDTYSILQHLKRERMRQKMTALKLAELAGVSSQAVANYENCRVDPQMGTVERCARALGYKMELRKERQDQVRADITLNDGRRMTKVFRNFDELSEFLAERYDTVSGVIAKLVPKGVDHDRA